MQRREFLASGLLSLASFYAMAKELKSIRRAPAIFVGHGSPMNAVELNEYSKKQKELSQLVSKPHAILIVSAHWETSGTFINKVDRPETIHDFGGFPRTLQDFKYNANGKTDLLDQTFLKLKNKNIQLTNKWGLDHGAWSILSRMYPKADVPVFQMSINTNLSMYEHLLLAEELKSLREKNLMILGSGNLVHNLQVSDDSKGFKVFDWALEFDHWIAEKIDKKDFKAIAKFEGINPQVVKLAHPTLEHFIPVLYSLGSSNPKEKIITPINGFQESSISMRSLIIT